MISPISTGMTNNAPKKNEGSDACKTRKEKAPSADLARRKREEVSKKEGTLFACTYQSKLHQGDSDDIASEANNKHNNSCELTQSNMSTPGSRQNRSDLREEVSAAKHDMRAVRRCRSSSSESFFRMDHSCRDLNSRLSLVSSSSMTSGKSLRRTSSILKAHKLSTPKEGLLSKRLFEYLLYTFVALLLQLILGWGYAFPDGRPACNFEDGQKFLSTNSYMCDTEIVLEEGVAQLRILVAFILGGFVTSTIYLWRLRRTAYCMLCGAARNLILNLATIMPSNNGDEELFQERKTMERWAVLGYELSVLKARGLADTDKGLEYLMLLGLVDEDEWENMVEGDRHTTVWFWIQQKAFDLAEHKQILSEHRLQTICNAVTLARDKGNDLMSCIDRDHPFLYSVVVGILVNTSMALFTLWKGILWAIWLYDEGPMLWTTPKMYVDLMVTLLYTALFAMMFDLSQALYNPFGLRSGIDIPHDVVSGGIRNLAKRLGEIDRCRPAALRATRDRSTRMRSCPSMCSVRNVQDNILFESKQVMKLDVPRILRRKSLNR